MFQPGPIRSRFRHVGDGQSDYVSQFRFLDRPGRSPAVINVFADAPILNQAGALELGKVGRDPGLPHSEDFLDLGD
jgi:hypothetical protein